MTLRFRNRLFTAGIYTVLIKTALAGPGGEGTCRLIAGEEELDVASASWVKAERGLRFISPL